MEIKIEGTAELSQALVDAFSPLTEFLGSLGDRVRIYRETTLLRCLKKAQQICQEESLIVKSPPLKFLVPFLEDCSLEHPEQEDMIAMWARLLVNASSDEKVANPYFVRVLRELSPEEARFIKHLVSPDTHSKYSGTWHLEDVESFWYDLAVKSALKQQIEEFESPLNSGFPFSQLEANFKGAYERPGSIVHFFDVGHGKPGNYPLEHVYIPNRHPVHDEFSELSISLLNSLGLIQSYSSPDFWFGMYAVQVEAYYITRLGSHFVEYCTNEPVNHKTR